MSGTAHRAIIEAGPGTIRRLCCGASMAATSEASERYAAALTAIDDHLALVNGRPVTVASLWHDVLRALDCGSSDATRPMIVVHPSWWPAARVGVITVAVNGVVTHPRSWLLTQASTAAPEATVVVEIAERLVSIVGGSKPEAVVALPRRTGQHPVAEEVAGVVARIGRGTTPAVLIDAPSTVAGAATVATLIAAAVRDAGNGQTPVVVDDARLSQLAQSVRVSGEDPGRLTANAGGVGSRGWKFWDLRPPGSCWPWRRPLSLLSVGTARRHRESRHYVSGRGASGADGSCELAHAARDWWPGFGAGAGHVAVGS